MSTDAELLERARDGDFEPLVEAYAGAVYGTALRFTRDPHEAEEVLQETFLTAVSKLDSFRQQAALGTWLTRVAINQALMRRRKRRPEEPLEQSGELVARRGDPEALFQRGELRDVLLRAVDSLPDSYREVFWLRDVEGLPNQEVADLLGLSLAAVKSRVLRARLALRDVVSPYLLEGGMSPELL